jgi:glycosyltransferase involved in cell wall biosynthesis
MTRILLDLTPLVTSAALRGIGRYVRGLVQGLHELGVEQWQGLEIRGLAASDEVDRLLAPIENLKDYSELAPRPLAKNCDLRRSSLVTFQFVSAARKAGARLVHVTEPRGTPMSRKPVVTVTSHDLIVLSQRKDYLPPIPGWSFIYRALEHLRYASAKRIVAISQATKRDLVELLGFDPARIDVVYHGVDHQRFRPEASAGEADRVAALLGSRAPYIVYLGAGDARKDLDTLVRAHARVARHGVRLVFAGNLKSARRSALEQLASRLGTHDSVHFAGFVPEEMIPALYRQAELHVFPSRYEGFGLPILEALACATPTITSPGSSLDEVAGDAAEIVPCGDPEQLARSIERILCDGALSDTMGNRGILRAREFTWARCARATIDFWHRTLLA